LTDELGLAEEKESVVELVGMVADQCMPVVIHWTVDGTVEIRGS
jgi:hypothetical protein